AERLGPGPRRRGEGLSDRTSQVRSRRTRHLSRRRPRSWFLEGHGCLARPPLPAFPFILVGLLGSQILAVISKLMVRIERLERSQGNGSRQRSDAVGAGS